MDTITITKSDESSMTVFIPRDQIVAFNKVLQRGMAFEHGQPESFFEFAGLIEASAMIEESNREKPESATRPS